MKNKKSILKVVLFFAFLVGMSFAGTGRVEKVSGRVTIKQSGKTLKAKKGMTVREGDFIITSSQSKIKILMEGGAIVNLGPSSKLKINKNNIKKKGGVTHNLSLSTGTVALKLSKLASRKSTFRVYTPNSVAGVRGTDFEVAAGLDGSSAVKVTDGKVNVQGQGGDVDVNANESSEAMIGENVKASKAKDEDMSKWLDNREKDVAKDPVGSVQKMQDYLAQVEKDAQKLAKSSEELAKQNVGKDKKSIEKKENAGLALNSGLNSTEAASEGVLENAKKIAKLYKKNKGMKEKLTAIERMNKSITGLNSRIDASLDALNARIAAAYKRIDDSWNKNEEKLNKRFNDSVKDHKDGMKGLDMDLNDDKFKLK